MDVGLTESEQAVSKRLETSQRGRNEKQLEYKRSASQSS